ncbi:hypothetical protein [Nostoc sp. DedQUE07]|uniref:hypothetical protein n=1 Tax=Nostoc sp. DedQUE07 TaxID=3075392 RepID=UPI002AD410A5|nr:hypothetical protein [Nostoc sp. DedQUE07]MDZ8131866.1 hypothetical protein [Nostoc sp. DedQUE07]
MSGNKEIPIAKGESDEYSRRNQGMTLFFGATKIHLDPLEILFLILLGLPVGIMIRDAPNATFEDAMKQVLAIVAAAGTIRKLPTDKAYQYLSNVSLEPKNKEDE